MCQVPLEIPAERNQVWHRLLSSWTTRRGFLVLDKSPESSSFPGVDRGEEKQCLFFPPFSCWMPTKTPHSSPALFYLPDPAGEGAAALVAPLPLL